MMMQCGRCMCNSASEDRTWVELREEATKEYAGWLKSLSAAAKASSQENVAAKRQRKDAVHSKHVKGTKEDAAGTKKAQVPNTGKQGKRVHVI